jgi:hypothetical protein
VLRRKGLVAKTVGRWYKKKKENVSGPSRPHNLSPTFSRRKVGEGCQSQLSGTSHMELSSHSLADGMEVTAGVELSAPRTITYILLLLYPPPLSFNYQGF